jgi:hypothetical protein
MKYIHEYSRTIRFLFRTHLIVLDFTGHVFQRCTAVRFYATKRGCPVDGEGGGALKMREKTENASGIV